MHCRFKMGKCTDCCERTFNTICGCLSFVIAIIILGFLGLAAFVYVIIPMINEDPAHGPITLTKFIQNPEIFSFADHSKPILVDGKVVAYIDFSKSQNNWVSAGTENEEKFRLGDEGVVKLNGKIVAYVEFVEEPSSQDSKRFYQINGCKWMSGPKATIANDATIEFGANIEGGATIKSGAIIEAKAVIETGAIVHEGVKVHAGARVKSGAIINANAEIKSNAIVGIGATIGHRSVIGSNVVVGDWAVVDPNSQLEGDAYTL